MESHGGMRDVHLAQIFFLKVFYYNAWEVTQEKHDQIFKHLRKHYY